MIHRLTLFVLGVIVVMIAISGKASCDDILVTNDAQFSAALDTATSGDRILLAPGTYGRFTRSGLSGITIRSQDANNPAVFNAAGQNEAMHLSSVTNVTVEHLIFENYTANGINIDDSGNWPGGKSNGVVLRDIIVRNSTAVSGNRDGIKISGVDNFHLNRVQVINWGTGGSAVDPVGSHHGIIENSRFVHSGTTASGVRPKGGSSDIEIRGNYFEMNGGRAIQFGGSTDPQFFRFPTGESNYEADNITATGNIVAGAESAISWVNIDGGIARYNLIDDPDRWVMRILNENAGNQIVDTQNGVFADNVVQFDEGLSRVVNIGPEVLAGTFSFSGNHWYDSSDPGLTEADLNLPADETGGIYGIDPGLDPADAFAIDTEWGIWIVNPHLSDQLLTIDNFAELSIATAGENAAFDPLAADPFQGDWTFTPLTSDIVLAASQSQTFLTVTAIPEPCAVTVLALALCFVRCRRSSRAV